MPGIRKSVDELARRTGRHFIIDGKDKRICLVELVGRDEFQRTPWRRHDDEFIEDVRAFIRLTCPAEQMELL